MKRQITRHTDYIRGQIDLLEDLKKVMDEPSFKVAILNIDVERASGYFVIKNNKVTHISHKVHALKYYPYNN